MRHAPRELFIAQQDSFPSGGGFFAEAGKRGRAPAQSGDVVAERFFEAQHLGAVEFLEIAGEVPGHLLLKGGLIFNRAPAAKKRFFGWLYFDMGADSLL